MNHGNAVSIRPKKVLDLLKRLGIPAKSVLLCTQGLDCYQLVLTAMPKRILMTIEDIPFTLNIEHFFDGNIILRIESKSSMYGEKRQMDNLPIVPPVPIVLN